MVLFVFGMSYILGIIGSGGHGFSDCDTMMVFHGGQEKYMKQENVRYVTWKGIIRLIYNEWNLYFEFNLFIYKLM